MDHKQHALKAQKLLAQDRYGPQSSTPLKGRVGLTCET